MQKNNKELETAYVRIMPGRISGRSRGRKFFPIRGIAWTYAELETAYVQEMPGRISGRLRGRKFFPIRGIAWTYAEPE